MKNLSISILIFLRKYQGRRGVIYQIATVSTVMTLTAFFTLANFDNILNYSNFFRGKPFNHVIVILVIYFSHFFWFLFLKKNRIRICYKKYKINLLFFLFFLVFNLIIMNTIK
jgi:hypothetical protein